MKINAEWHRGHPMPRNPSFEQRVEWHLEHAKHCACRPIAGKLLEEMEAKGIKLPSLKPDQATAAVKTPKKKKTETRHKKH